MDYRKENFVKKFESANKHLKAEKNQITSLKYRDIVNHEEYDILLHELEKRGFKIKPVEGDFQGKAYLVSDREQQIIIVEHETGLEILYSEITKPEYQHLLIGDPFTFSVNVISVIMFIDFIWTKISGY